MKPYLLTIACAATGLMIGCGTASKPSAVTPPQQKEAKAWVAGGSWSNGLNLTLHPSADAAAFAAQYEKNKAAWDKAFQFLKATDLQSLEPGKHPIIGEEVFALVSQAPSKEFDQSAWEAHRKYVDLQYVIQGKEKIGVTPAAGARVTRPYDEAKDLVFFEAEGEYFLAEPGTFFLFFPSDAHRPNIKVEGYDVVKKIVIKIKVAE